MVKKVKTKDVAAASETTVAAVPTKNKIVKPVPSPKVSADGKKAKPVKNGADANTNGTTKGVKKAQKLKEKVEENGVVPQTDEPVAVPAKKNKTSKTPVAEAANDSVVSEEKVPAPVAEEEPEKSAENGTETKNQRKRRLRAEKKAASGEENGDGEAVPKKKAKSDSKKITAGTTLDKVPGIKQKFTNKEQHAKNLAERSKRARKKELKQVLSYLDAWKNSREEWKFQKLRQMYIQENIFDEKIFKDDIFPTALEYLGGTKGQSLTNLLVQARLVIKDIDSAAGADDTADESVKYKRAREVLQTLG